MGVSQRMMQAAAGFVPQTALYVEDVFSTHLYTGNGTTQNINNGINLGSYPVIATHSHNTPVAGSSGSHTFSNLQSGDWLIIHALYTGTGSMTLNGSTLTADSSSTNWYNNYIYIEELTGPVAALTYSDSGGSGHIDMMVMRGPTSVSVAQAVQDDSGADFTTSSITTSGFGLVIVSDRDSDVSPSIAGGTTTLYHSRNHTYFRVRWWGVNGNGTTVPAVTVSNLSGEGPYNQNFAVLKIEGCGSTATTNAVAGDGGMVWIKDRVAAQAGRIQDTERGASANLIPSGTNASQSLASVSAFSSSGFALTSSDSNTNGTASSNTFVAWTFREAENFFDVVTYTGDGANSKVISHNLGSTPGMIIIKNTSAASNWVVYHRSQGDYNLLLNSTNPSQISNVSIDLGASYGGYIAANPTSTTFTVVSTDPNSGSLNGNTNVNTNTHNYVAYLFAHDTTDEGLIQCASYTKTGAGIGTAGSVNLGWEPQFVMIKNISAVADWQMYDVMRGLSPYDSATGGTSAMLEANTSDAESISANDSRISLLSTGFQYQQSGTDTFIYLAIRRGPMAEPTIGTQVFSAFTGNTTNPTTISTGFPPDMVITKDGRASTSNNFVHDRLRGANASTGQYVISANSTSAEVASSGRTDLATTSNGYRYQSAITSLIGWAFRRYPGVFDIVCYTGNSNADDAKQTINHNLGIAPELIITKCRSASTSGQWMVGYNFGATAFDVLYLYLNNAATTEMPYDTYGVYGAQPTATTYSVGNQQAAAYANNLNESGVTYVSYLFSSLASVSKVGSYTGTGTTKQVDCGFSAGARFVMIKRTDSTGDWYVFDTARGIIAGNDPYLLINSTAAEVTNTDYIDSYSAGFELSSTAPAGMNANGGTYIFLAIA